MMTRKLMIKGKIEEVPENLIAEIKNSVVNEVKTVMGKSYNNYNVVIEYPLNKGLGHSDNSNSVSGMGGDSCISKDGKSFRIRIEVELAIFCMMNDAREFAIKKLKNIARHEAFHVMQYIYLLKRGGMRAVNNALKAFNKYSYHEHPMEKGAYDFADRGIIRDFRELDEFVPWSLF